METAKSGILSEWIYDFFINLGLSVRMASYFDLGIKLIITAVFLWLGTHIIRWAINMFLQKAMRLKRISFLGHLYKNNFSKYLSLFVPYLGTKNFIPFIFSHFPVWISPLNKVLDIWVIYLFIKLTMSLCKAGFDILSEKPAYKDKPTKSYLQVINIVLIIIGILITIAILSNAKISTILTSIAAGSAIFMLIFQDSIKGFVASVQVTANDMIRIGDWITMPKYNADGDVMEVNLTTVKVRNFDKTVSTIPTYAMISDSFQNWRGMQSAGGRRIKRAIMIKQNSIRYIKDDEIERFKKIQGISDYIDERQKIIAEHNKKIGADRSVAVNGRNLTNAGLFRQYIEWYLHNHPDTHKDFTMMVRQLAPTSTGMPLELYAFTNTTKWIAYENIMSDIFDHLIAAVPYFDLEIFEIEAGTDIRHVDLTNK